MARDEKLIARAKQMRRDPSPMERTLWHALRARRFHDAKFRRQVVIGPYIADFACRIPKMMVIEIDGDTHAAQPAYDARRDAHLRARGYEILRFTNREVTHNLEGVLTAIANALNPLSPSGERRERQSRGRRGAVNRRNAPPTPSLPPLAAAPSLP